MSITRSLLALTIGFGFSLAACTGELDTDLDLDTDAPDMEPMGLGQGLNGTDPEMAGPCLKGIFRAANEQPGQDPNAPNAAYNPALDDYRCNGQLVSDPNSDPASPPITDPTVRDEVLEVMAWAGAYKGQTIGGFDGNSFMDNDWATQAVPTGNGRLHQFASLVLAKFNNGPEVRIGMEGPALSHPDRANDDISDYPIEESMIAVNVAQGTGEIRSLLVFGSDNVLAACGSNYWQYFIQRYCHNPLINPSSLNCFDVVWIRPESEVSNFCTRLDGSPAANIEEAYRCDNNDVLKIYVAEGELDYTCGSIGGGGGL